MAQWWALRGETRQMGGGENKARRWLQVGRALSHTEGQPVPCGRGAGSGEEGRGKLRGLRPSSAVTCCAHGEDRLPGARTGEPEDGGEGSWAGCRMRRELQGAPTSLDPADPAGDSSALG